MIAKNRGSTQIELETGGRNQKHNLSKKTRTEDREISRKRNVKAMLSTGCGLVFESGSKQKPGLASVAPPRNRKRNSIKPLISEEVSEESGINRVRRIQDDRLNTSQPDKMRSENAILPPNLSQTMNGAFQTMNVAFQTLFDGNSTFGFRRNTFNKASSVVKQENDPKIRNFDVNRTELKTLHSEIA